MVSRCFWDEDVNHSCPTEQISYRHAARGSQQQVASIESCSSVTFHLGHHLSVVCLQPTGNTDIVRQMEECTLAIHDPSDLLTKTGITISQLTSRTKLGATAQRKYDAILGKRALEQNDKISVSCQTCRCVLK